MLMTLNVFSFIVSNSKLKELIFLFENFFYYTAICQLLFKHSPPYKCVFGCLTIVSRSLTIHANCFQSFNMHTNLFFRRKKKNDDQHRVIKVVNAQENEYKCVLCTI